MAWEKSVEAWGDDFVARANRMLDLYCAKLTDLGYEPKAYPDMAALVGSNMYSGGKYDAMCHALWMCAEARKFIKQGREAKAYRWIGMMQGILWMGGVYSIEDLRSHNELPPEEWGKGRK